MVVFLRREEALLRPGFLSNFTSNFEPFERRLSLRTESLGFDFLGTELLRPENAAEPGERGLRLGLRVKIIIGAREAKPQGEASLGSFGHIPIWPYSNMQKWNCRGRKQKSPHLGDYGN